ncbi:DUF885 domain-containing protein [Alteromonas sp. NFXS44]|uniref:DUF885 domain-containing protein n=1 Tax=Alteromonas sp. NFXS44 TaxID=2818435 RepID=UPI0032DE318E
MKPNMKTLAGFALSLVAASVIGCSPASEKTQETTAHVAAEQTAQSETERLNAWFEEQYEKQLQMSPITLTMRGRKERYGEIDDASEKAAEERFAMLEAAVEEMKSTFDYDKLDDASKISWNILVYSYEQDKLMKPFERREYIFNQMFGMHTSLPTVLINYHKVESEQDLKDYVSRLGETGRAMDQLIDRARINADEGVKSPYFAYQGVIEQSKGIISGKPFDDSENDSALYADFKAKAQSLVDAGELTQEQADGYLKDAETMLTTKLGPAYQTLIDWFEADLPSLDKSAKGVWALPDGEAYYNAMLARSTTTDMTADEIHELGLEEVARIRKEMEKVKAELGFEGSLREMFDYFREDKTDERLYYPNTDEGREGYLSDTRTYINNMKEMLPDYFGRLPKADLVVKRVEPFREQPGAAQHYYPSSPDGKTPGVYYVHLIDMTMMPKSEMEAIAYHEGVPGHHMQIAIAQELEDIPTFRTQMFFTSYVEGWALYAERLASEMGAYKEPVNNFGRLHSEMWRAIRLVLDTGIHAKKWTEQQAVDYFIDNSPISEGQAKSEVQRYFVMPGQATAYKIGMLKILELREKAKTALGDKFDIRGFHDLVLGGGAVPLSTLELMVDDWIKSQS